MQARTNEGAYGPMPALPCSSIPMLIHPSPCLHSSIHPIAHLPIPRLRLMCLHSHLSHLSVPTIAHDHLCLHLFEHMCICACLYAQVFMCTCIHAHLYGPGFIVPTSFVRVSFVHACCHCIVSTQILCSYLTYLVLSLNCIGV